MYSCQLLRFISADKELIVKDANVDNKSNEIKNLIEYEAINSEAHIYDI